MITDERKGVPVTRPNRWRTVVLIALVTVLTAELAARVVEPMLETPLRWPTAQVAEKADQIRQLADEGTTIDVVFLGSSVVALGIDPVKFNEGGAGLIAYNAGLNGAAVSGLERWAFDVVLPLLKPKTVVIGLTTRDLNDHGRLSADFLQSMDTAEGWKDFEERNPFERFIDTIQSSSALVRIRPLLRTPATTARHAINGNGDPGLEAGPFGSEGEPSTVPYNPEAWTSLWTINHVNDYSLGGQELVALDQLVTRLNSEGIEVVLAEMPVLPEYLSVQPGGNEALAEFRRAVQDIATKNDVTFLSAGSQFGPDDFRDPAHLNQAASGEFAESLREQLAKQG